MKCLTTLLLSLCISTFVSGQSIITATSTSPTPANDCNDTYLTVDLTNYCANYAFLGNTVSVAGNTITVSIDYSVGIICLTAIQYTNQVINLGQLSGGTYTINISTYINSNFSSNATINNFVVQSCCGASSAFTANQSTICLGDTLDLTNTSTGLDSVHWYLDGLLVDTSFSPSIIPSANGTYDLSLVAFGDTCNDTSSASILVVTAPVIDLGNDTTICEGATLPLGVNGAFSSYLWSDGGTSSTNGIDTIETKWVVATTNIGCLSSDTISVIDILEKTDVDLGPDLQICPVDSATLMATTLFNSYLWSNGSTNSTITTNTPGQYWLEATADGYCAGRDTIQLDHFTLPPLDLTIDSQQCDSVSVAASQGFATYSWSNGSQADYTTFYASSTFSLTVVDANGCVQSSTDSATVFESPTIYLGQDTQLCEGQSLSLFPGTFASYLWSDSTMDSTLIISSPGNYWVEVQTENGCFGRDTITIDKCVGIKERHETFELFPNPTSGFTTIRATSALLGATVSIFDMHGSLVHSEVIEKEVNKLDIQHLSPGSYVLSIQQEGNWYHQVLIVN